MEEIAKRRATRYDALKQTTNVVGMNLARIRREKQIIQVDLSEKAGLSQQAISAYERGVRAPKYFATLRLAAALDCAPEDIDPRIADRLPEELKTLAALWPRLNKTDRRGLAGLVRAFEVKYKERKR